MSVEAPFEVVGVKDITDPTTTTPFIVVRIRNNAEGREKFLLKTGEGVSWEVSVSSVSSRQEKLPAVISEILSVSLRECWGHFPCRRGSTETFSR